MNQYTEKLTIGRKDKVDFPKLKLFNIDAKVDTGAYTTSIHCSTIDLVKENSKKYVRFKLLDSTHPKYQKKIFKLPVYKEKTVKNSFGESEHRFLVKTKIRLFGKDNEIELSLTNREKMTYPVLIGRKLLSKNFIVDVNRYNLSYRQKRKNKEKK
ncbi:MAG: peptidase [Candidatus Dadabacteria bacterium]|nr:peptidase [Candidatus Dadabacteria bacterium]NIS07687.1 peptidase [Candidatus Dadabacteria bacterium]NIV42266.1 peptidase [Candidatus Dadabacteria bacterium]NIX14773.1 peptidase [Candidatus Dadabacteria bacterium]NIY21314.1 peptidase [Candidatus Dadabacteria bacterium]